MLEQNEKSILPGTTPSSGDLLGVKACIKAIGGKWKLLLLAHLAGHQKRYGELRRLVPEITEKMLIQQLRELEEDGIITRRAYPTIPPKVEYTLSMYGETICPLLQDLSEWGKRHQEYRKRQEDIKSEAQDMT